MSPSPPNDIRGTYHDKHYDHFPGFTDVHVHLMPRRPVRLRVPDTERAARVLASVRKRVHVQSYLRLRVRHLTNCGRGTGGDAGPTVHRGSLPLPRIGGVWETGQSVRAAPG